MNKCKNFRIKPASRGSTLNDLNPDRCSFEIGSKKELDYRQQRDYEKEARANDQFIAASIGDVVWLEASLQFQDQVEEEESSTKASEKNDDKKRSRLTFDKNGFAPIHLAAADGHLECLQLLIERYGIDVNLKSAKDGWSPIHLCISNRIGQRAVDCLRYLLLRGADHSISNEAGITPAHRAAMESQHQCLIILIKAGAAIHTLDRHGFTPAQYTRNRDSARILRYGMWHRNKELEARQERRMEISRMRRLLLDMSMINNNTINDDENSVRRCESLSCSRSISRQSNHLSREKGNNSRIGFMRTAKDRPRSSFDIQLDTAVVVYDDKNMQRDNKSRYEKLIKVKRAQNSASGEEGTNTWCSWRKDNDVCKNESSTRDSLNSTIAMVHTNRCGSAFGANQRVQSASTVSSSQKIRLKHATRNAEKVKNGINSEMNDEEVSSPNFALLSYSELKELTCATVNTNNTMFTSQSIINQTARRHYNPDILPKAEISLHLLNDQTSWLFKNALIARSANRAIE